MLLLLFHVWENVISIFEALRFLTLFLCWTAAQSKRFSPGRFGVFECVWQRDVKSETTC